MKLLARQGTIDEQLLILLLIVAALPIKYGIKLLLLGGKSDEPEFDLFISKDYDT